MIYHLKFLTFCPSSSTIPVNNTFGIASCDAVAGSCDAVAGSCDVVAGSCDTVVGSCESAGESCDSVDGSCDSGDRSCDVVGKSRDAEIRSLLGSGDSVGDSLFAVSSLGLLNK